MWRHSIVWHILGDKQTSKSHEAAHVRGVILPQNSTQPNTLSLSVSVCIDKTQTEISALDMSQNTRKKSLEKRVGKRVKKIQVRKDKVS